MLSPEFEEYNDPAGLAVALGELALTPKPSLIELVSFSKTHEPIGLITRQSFVTHQNTSDAIHSSRVAYCAWTSISACVQGTKAALKRTTYNPNTPSPDFTDVAVVHRKKQELIGYNPAAFSNLVQVAIKNQKRIPNLGTTQVIFLQDLSQAILHELA